MRWNGRCRAGITGCLDHSKHDFCGGEGCLQRNCALPAWPRPYDDCVPRTTAVCSVGGFPASQSYYTAPSLVYPCEFFRTHAWCSPLYHPCLVCKVRMKERCTDPLADSPWVEWPNFVLTWPEPAQIPSNFTTVELTAYNMSGTWSG